MDCIHCLGILVRIPCSYNSIAFQVVTPTGNVLVDDLTLKVESGSNLLITGNVLNLKRVSKSCKYLFLDFPFPCHLSTVSFCLFVLVDYWFLPSDKSGFLYGKKKMKVL